VRALSVLDSEGTNPILGVQQDFIAQTSHSIIISRGCDKCRREFPSCPHEPIKPRDLQRQWEVLRDEALLDTHTCLVPIRIQNDSPTQHCGSLRTRRTKLWLSPITPGSLMLQRKGRIRFARRRFLRWLSKSTAGIFEAPLTHYIALASHDSCFSRDPADRFPLAATAKFST